MEYFINVTLLITVKNENILICKYFFFLQKEAGKTMIEKFQQHAQEKKIKIQELGNVVQQKGRGGKRKRKGH